MDELPARPEAWRRLFTVEEANAALPELIPLLQKLRDTKAAWDEARFALERLTPAMRGNGHGGEAAALEGRLQRLAQEIAEGVREIRERGVEIKDLAHGLIDFPCLRGETVVFLCWHLGEGEIAFWHEVDAGFAGRQPL
jgi:hypothetical protein